MLTHDRIIQGGALLLAVFCLVAAAAFTPMIDAQRREMQLTYDWAVDEQTMPPGVALSGAALGSFRGLIVDWLWYRAHTLKEAGKFYEANQLSKTITQLQPRFPDVWAFHAWNMAYNISVATNTADERWYWVSNGIDLLRSQGIPLNPRTPILYKELAWIFTHKVGQTSDDMHWYYKRKLAVEWQKILGTPTEGSTTKQAATALRRIADAPDDLLTLFETSPEVRPLWDFIAGLGYKADAALLMQIGGILMYNYSPDESLWASIGMVVPEQYDQRLNALFKRADLGPGVQAFLAYLRKRVLISDYHMDPAMMAEVMEIFGPLDWRHPAAHGCFWNHLGVRAADDDVNQPDIGKTVNIYRGRIHTLQFLAQWGRVVFDPRIDGPPDLLPDPRFVASYELALDEVKQFLLRQEETKATLNRQGTLNSFESGHENFLQKYVVDLFFLGDRPKADELYKKLRDLYAEKERYNDRYLKPLEEFVFQEYKDNWDIMRYLRGSIAMLIHRNLDRNRPDWFSHGLDNARYIHAEYLKDRPINNIDVDRNRQDIPTNFEEIIDTTYVDYMSNAVVQIEKKARIWKNTPLPIQRRVYDRIYPRLLAQVERNPKSYDVDKIMPSPATVDVFRKQRPAVAETIQKGQAGTATVERQ